MKPKNKRYRLLFGDDTGHPGLEVTMRGMSAKEYLRIMRHMVGLNITEMTNESVAAAETVIGLMADYVTEWNLEDDDGKPVPPTAESLLDQDLDLVLAVLTQWTTAIGGVAPPLPSSSNGGGSYPEASIPMVPLSPNLSS